ncbi:MAG: DUF4920 domain-containing protein, partial [Flavobacteriaceae bacterium]|nr:DUF4920 domain-containing protein [Flavobacteriaceae bacterium]
MKKIVFLLITAMTLIACKNASEANNNTDESVTAEVEEVSVAYQTFGEGFDAEGILTKDEMIKEYQNLKEGDTVEVRFTSKVNSVCQAKGCWMRL